MTQYSKSFYLRCTVLLLTLYYRLLERTVALDRAGLDAVRQRLAAQKPVVLTTPHTVLLPSVLAMRGLPATFLASQSQDGSLIAGVLRAAGFQVARGSSSRGAVAGLTELLRALRRGGIVGLTHDGPKGPPLVPKPGVALLASHARGGVFLLLPSFKPRLWGLWPGFVRVNSWDRFHVVLPFAKVIMDCVAVAPEGDAPGRSSGSQDILATIERESRAALGALYRGEQETTVSSPEAR